MAVRTVPGLGPRALGLVVLLIGGSFMLPPAESDAGGPDAYGYVWVDNRAPSPVIPYSWVDITSTGTRVALGADDCTYELSMGFQFRWYGVLVDQIYVCSNGFVTFSIQGFGFERPIPNASAPNDRIVALGMDLYPPTSGTGGVFVQSIATTTPRKFIITWNLVVTQYTYDQQTFQLILEQNQTSRDGRIFMQYKSLTNMTSPLVGIENGNGSSGLEYPYVPSNGRAVAFLPPSDAGLPPDTLTVIPASLAPPTTSQGNRNVLMMQLDLLTSSNDILVSEIDVALSGFNAGAEDVPLATAWLDNGDTGFSPSNDFPLRTALMLGSPARARIGLVPSIRVSMTSVPRVFITYDIAPGAGVGDFVGAAMAAASAVSVEFPDRVAPGGFPAETYIPGVQTRIDASVDTLALLTTTDRLPTKATQWRTDVPIMSLQFGVGSNVVDLAGLTLEIGGNATASDVWRVKAIEDIDRDASYTPGVDAVLDVVSPSGTPFVANLTTPRTLAAGTLLNVLLLFDVGPEALVGNFVNFSLNATGIHLVSGSADILSPSNLPVLTGNATIDPGQRPALFPAWSGVPPSADRVWGPGEYVLGPADTDILDPPAGNRVPGYLTVENNETMLFVAIDATGDTSSSTGDGVAIGFDTDRNGLPTNGSDDVYVANATGGSRLLYNDTAAGWVPVLPCDAVGGNETTPACAAGFQATELLGATHSFYEFAIPLALLGVTTPVPPGTVLRFALGAPPYDGLADEFGRSTWPILFDPLPSLRHFADLNLVAAPVINLLPRLNWTGEPGYVTDGLEPETGLRDEIFQWRIVYDDRDNDPPAYAQPRLQVYRDGVALPESPFAMTEADPTDNTYLDGKVYLQSVRVNVCGGNFTYEFTARDGLGGVALPMNGTGPVVGCPDLPPTLFLPQVSPGVGLPGTFTYRIAYSDPENRSAAYVEATVALGGTDQQMIAMSPAMSPNGGWVGTRGDYAQGAWYEGSAVLVLDSTNYTYRFKSSDGNTTVDAGPFLGPKVVPRPPDKLRVSSGDLAPLVEDEGTHLVEFLSLILYTTDAEVNVTSIRVDRIGSAADSEVPDLLLYDDLDHSGRLDPGDVLLGSRPLLLGFAQFSVSLRIIPANASYVLVVANLAMPGTADATIGFELSAPSSIGVGADDAVQPFATPVRSTRTLVNVRPRVSGLTVEGWAPGTTQISHIFAAAPRIAWTFQDNNSADLFQRAFNVSIWSESPPVMLWSLEAPTSASSIAYTGPPFTPGGKFRAEVRVFDNRLWSATWVAAFRQNSPSAAPVLLNPANLAVGVPTTTTLTWETLTDPEGDTIRYFSWVSTNPGFSSPFANESFSASVTLALAGGTEYFWKVGASDGYEFTSGNSTVWRFTTVSPTAPVLGDVRGRVINGTSSMALAGALVELLNGTQVANGMVTGADGRFAFGNLSLGPYTVRVSAFGFVPQTRAAAPTRASPSVDLADISLAASGGPGPNGGDGTVILSWLPFILGIVVGLAILLFLVSRRRSRQEESSSTTDPLRVQDASVEAKGPVRAEELSAVATDGKSPSVSEPAFELVFECPVCGRSVEANAMRCVCGAMFDA